MKKPTPPGLLKKGNTAMIQSWVRAGAVADVDFVSVPPRAYAGGAEVGLSDILGDSVLMNVVFNPNDIIPGVGFHNPEVTAIAALIGALRTALQSAFTMQIEFLDRFRLELTEETFATDIVAKHIDGQQPSLTDGNVALVTGNGTTGPHKMAFTVTDALSYASVDNVRLDDEGDPASTTIVLPLPNVPTDIILSASSGTIQRLTVYPVKTEDQTQALSA